MLVAAMHLIAVAVDLLILLFLVRLVRPHVRWRMIAAVDDAGRPVVDAVMEAVTRLRWFQRRNFSRRTVFKVCLLGLLIFRLGISLMAG